ncbi:MAG: hypothetical protein Q7S51_02995 [Gallionellaceae bacterium]|nr:hypothetical protein [Gallionellaceae bacterium]
MKDTPEWLALQQAHAVCRVHQEALCDAINDLKQRNLVAADLLILGKEDRRLLDQFAYRYTRLQDDMGTKLYLRHCVHWAKKLLLCPCWIA